MLWGAWFNLPSVKDSDMTEFVRAPRANRFVNPGVAKSGERVVTPKTPSIQIPSLAEIAQLYQLNPLGFVLNTFHWEEGEGIDPWQRDVLETIGDELDNGEPIHRFAISSGKGAGKTSVAAWLFLWHVACHEGKSQTVCTSVTGFQTASRLWREIRKWRNRWILRPYFSIHSTRLEHVAEDTWYGLHQTWNIDRPEAFQGTHETYTGFFVDEASGIPDAILETIESGATDEHVIIVYISNATRSKGRFRECFRRFADWWVSWNIDTRNVERVSRASIQKALDEVNGDVEASSFRRDVRGEFPLEDYDQVIPEWIIEKACARTPDPYDHMEPVVIGCDIARKGRNKTVFTVRQGTSILEQVMFPKQETDITTDRLLEMISRYRTRANLRVFVDADGMGIGVVDGCNRQLSDAHIRLTVEKVDSSLPAFRHKRYANRRAEMWYTCREWLVKEGVLSVTDTVLTDQLTDIYYKHDDHNRLLIESKEDMIGRGVMSPDHADSLVYTFAGAILPRAGVWTIHV
jgi:phage terminase large subunit